MKKASSSGIIKQAVIIDLETNHIIEPRRRQFSHHRLQEGIKRCLKHAKANVVQPNAELREHGFFFRRTRRTKIPKHYENYEQQPLV